MTIAVLFVLGAFAWVEGEPEQTPQDLFWQKLVQAGDRSLTGEMEGEQVSVQLRIKGDRKLHLIHHDRVVWELSRTGSGLRLLWRDSSGDLSYFDTFDIGQPDFQELDAADETIAGDARKKRWRWVWRWEGQALRMVFMADGYQAVSETRLAF